MVEAKWLASLSDGCTAVEGKAPFEFVNGGFTPWRKLRNYLSGSDLFITCLRLQVTRPDAPSLIINMPSTSVNENGRHERWTTLTPLIPESFDCKRYTEGFVNYKDGKPVGVHASAGFVVAVAKYKDFSLSVYLETFDGNEFSLVVHENKKR